MPPCDSVANVDGDADRSIGFFPRPTFSILPFIEIWPLW